MILYAPFEISSRLLASVKIGGAVLSLGRGPRNHQGRTVYECWIDLPDGSKHAITDLRSGCGGGSVKEGFSALFSFLSAAAESRNYRERMGRTEPDPDSNEGLFEPAIVAWAVEHEDEITCLGFDLDEGSEPLIVEE